MAKSGVIGILLIFASFVLFAFELIGKGMDNDTFQDIRLLDLVGEDKMEMVKSIQIDFVQGVLSYILTEAIYIPLFILGVIFLLVSSFSKK